MASNKAIFNRLSLEPTLRKFFFWYGGVAFDFRWAFFIVPIAISVILSTGFLWFSELRIDDPSYVFTPRDSRWKKELATFSRLWPLQENRFLPGKSFEMKRFVNVLCKAKDGGNILRPQILDEIELLNRFIMENITVPTYDRKFNLSYQDLCLSYDWVCGANEHIRMFREMTRVGRVIDLKFPKGGNKDTPAYLGTAIGDIKLNATDRTVIEAKITQLFYFLKQEPDLVSSYSMDFEYAVERFVLRAFESDLITLSFAHYHSLQDGLDENARRFLPNFVTSFAALTIFCIACAFTMKRDRKFSIDWVRSKPYIACAGLVNTLLALISAFGIMLLLGIPYNVVNTIIPFLIIAIGVDDMFIMNACWDQTETNLPPKLRMEQTLRSGGVAVSITNITDILAFLIGCATELPGIEVFCLYAFASVLFCYIYQLTFFAGFMSIMGVAEHGKRHCLFLHKKKERIRPIRGAIPVHIMTREKVESFNTSSESASPVSSSNPESRESPADGYFRSSAGAESSTISEFDSTEYTNTLMRKMGKTKNTKKGNTLTDEKDSSDVSNENIANFENTSTSTAKSFPSTVEQRGIIQQESKTLKGRVFPIAEVLHKNAKSELKLNERARNKRSSPKRCCSQCNGHFKESSKRSNKDFSSDESYPPKYTKNKSALDFFPALEKPLNPFPLLKPDKPPLNATHRFFGQYFGPLIINNFFRAFIIISYIAYIALAIVGCANFREGLEPSHLVTADHYISQYFRDMKIFWKIGPQLHVAILNPPNLTDPINREQLMALVRSFEDTEYTMGREGTVFFFLEYLNYLDQLDAELENTDRIWNQKLLSWLKFTGGSNQWETDIVFNNITRKIDAYRFQVAMKNIVEPNQHKLAAKLLRQIADEQPYQVEVYYEAFPFADQYLIILPSTIRNVLISLGVMTIVAFLLIPSIPSAILIILSIISISTGVFGYMTFWGVNLDAVSMISIIMSIGFAVDLSAHIVYAFVTANGDTKERVVGALEHLGWPIFQGAFSTIIGISVLYTVDAYIILTFFKTIWLTMMLGLIHGLIFMPVMLSFIPMQFFRIASAGISSSPPSKSVEKH